MNTTPAHTRPIRILLAEDNPADAELTRFALEETGMPHILQHVEDGEEALMYINAQGKYKNAELPGLILLDLNMPKISGKEVLKEIKSNKAYNNIPVVILTSSQARVDINDAYNLKADYYITKPASAEKILAAFSSDTSSEWFLD